MSLAQGQHSSRYVLESHGAKKLFHLLSFLPTDRVGLTNRAILRFRPQPCAFPGAWPSVPGAYEQRLWRCHGDPGWVHARAQVCVCVCVCVQHANGGPVVVPGFWVFSCARFVLHCLGSLRHGDVCVYKKRDWMLHPLNPGLLGQGGVFALRGPRSQGLSKSGHPVLFCAETQTE